MARLAIPRIALGLVILAALAAGSLLMRGLYAASGQTAAVAAPLDPAGKPSLSRAGFTTDAVITNLQGYLSMHPEDGKALGNLGTSYLQKARETGDPGYYTLAEGALQKAFNLDPSDFRTLTALGSLALSRHQFAQGLEWGRRAQLLNSDNAGVYGIMGDAQIELGHYPEAFDLFDRMVERRPDLASYARISYARELRGDQTGALEAMQSAVEADAPDSEAANWARVQLGNLLFNRGDFSTAARVYQTALEFMPHYPYAQAGLASVRAAQGDDEEAVRLYREAIQTMPLPQFVIALGDLYQVMGRRDEAARQYDLVNVEARLYQANGVEMDAEMALFFADHGRNLPEALQRARAAYAARPSVTVADVLAWTLYQTGDYAAAGGMIQQAMRLGTRSALMDYHAGMIAYRLGDGPRATEYLERALALNPQFSLLYAPQARALLSSLGRSNLQPGDPSFSPRERFATVLQP